MIKFKEKRHENEWSQLESNNLTLFNLIKALSLFVKNNFNKDVVLTHIFRTAEEQNSLYASTPNPPTTSPHMDWAACDLRSSVYTDAEIKQIVDFCNLFKRKDGRVTALYHKISGNVYHLHIQMRD